MIDGILELGPPNYRPYEKELREYLNKYPEAKDYTIFIDLKAKPRICFGLAMIKGLAGDETVFKTTQPTFKESRFGKKLFDNIENFHENILGNSEILYSSGPALQDPGRFKDQKILIIFGGPSVNDVAWKSEDYDQTWSVNQFFLNSRASQEKISLSTIASDQDHNDPRLHDYLTRHPETVILFEIDRVDDLQKMNDFYKRYPERTMFFAPRYGSCIGIAPKIILYAMMTGASEIAFVGMDGRNTEETDGKLAHAFDGNKPMPGWWKAPGAERLQRRQFILFYETISMYRDMFGLKTKIKNLSAGHPLNKLGEISQHYET